MNGKTLKLLLIIIIPLMFFSCDSKKSNQEKRVVIGIVADVQTFNTLFAFSFEEAVITELLYPGLIGLKWNADLGMADPLPMIAKSWQWADDSSFIKFILRDDVYWSDGQKLTAEDVIFSYDIFSDPDVQSRLYNTFTQFYIERDGRINIGKTFRLISPYELEVHFPSTSVPNLNEFDLPLVPKHVFEKLDRKNLANNEINFQPVTCGAFRLKKWERNQSITLETDSSSFLFRPGQVPEFVFKIVPDYTSRILQLEKGELDLVDVVKVEDVDKLKKDDQLVVVPEFGREYDYIGWNNVDPESLSRGERKPNKLFGTSNIRKAMSMAINRKEIFEEYLQGMGELATSPVSPIFKSAFNIDVKPYNYNPDEAKKLLASEGWKDEDNDGVLEKGNEEFRFTMYYPVGNPLREYASVVIKNNLKSVGIEMIPEKIELGAFIDNLYKKKLDSWMAAWGVSINLKLKIFWYSDPKVASLNFLSYSNSDIDNILDQLDTKITDERKNELIKKFQVIIHEDEPVTFLYWTPNIVVYNKRIKNLDITPYGVIVRCWEWTLDE
jgi:peptide/nickel transport system substrate-binding protein